ncbi:putative nuclease HARBI1 [Eupeodes corollae]|uniref:putative nuclease HARBI1 n=1 Tax=Eupeodes corollae TaxID=290404 RepID=UPI002493CD2B|nr:putative nuclease HARBI1 [Eupeodes corollae]XP_055906021.1 putative nuclease HARBI1 [Eupeodes corollae]
MVICDHKMRIMAINARYGGSAHDSFVWKHSNERQFFENTFNVREHNYWLLGDSGYPLEPWLLSPYRSSSDETKSHFNNVHAKARNVIERCIGILKGRWRILLEERKSCYEPIKIATFANVCAALHNICIYYNVENGNILIEDENFPSYGLSESQISSENNAMKQLAINIRDDIKNSFLT